MNFPHLLLKMVNSSAGEGISYAYQYSWTSLLSQLLKNPPAIPETWVPSLGWEDPLEKGKSTHSSILAQRIPWTVQSMGLNSLTSILLIIFLSIVYSKKLAKKYMHNIFLMPENQVLFDKQSTTFVHAFAHVVGGSPAAHTPIGTFLQKLTHEFVVNSSTLNLLCLYLILIFINVWTHYLIYYGVFFSQFHIMLWRYNHVDISTSFNIPSACILYFIDQFY